MLDSFQNIIFLVCGTIVLFLLYFLYFLLKNNKQISSLKDEINNNKIFITGFKLKEDEHLKQIQSLEMALEQNLVQYREEAKQQQKVLHLQEEMYEEKIKTLAEENKNNLLTKVKEAREDTLKKSRSVLRGQATEHLAPFLIKGVNPKDYRFLGSPVDYICFDGLSDILDGESNEIKEVKFILKD